jgi:hypothetical protein
VQQYNCDGDPAGNALHLYRDGHVQSECQPDESRALDFGIIIDGAVVIVENCIRRLSHAQEHFKRELTLRERFHEVFAAAKEARRPLLFGQLIIMVVLLPIFALLVSKARCSIRWPLPWLSHCWAP